MILFRDKLPSVLPRQAAVYKTFLHQEWRLFEIARNHNRKMNIIVRDKINPLQADTVDMVQYLVAQKRKYAPFNNYEDAMERLLSNIMNRLENQLTGNKEALKKKFPGKPESFYMEQTSLLTEADTMHNENLQNIIAYGKYILEKQKINTAGKEYKLSLIYKYIPPENTALKGNAEDIIFTTAYKNF